ncbi:conserved hypothetical protein [Candidatus Desulfarcum epimagneticum]|uniref:Methyltransferase domain-containing protein n=1 Tax=uncultured Desulfobacteraceae bacterium TaxID=218296 RepID=A0A484HJ64_9BACT|nr:conserved hypothetical protein [uncultured Desulfobacteraceae bacterium]
MTYEKLYSYYQKTNLLPTAAGFSSKDDLEKYEAYRYSFLLNKLSIPPQIFKARDLIEFGPDSGENSLVFAKWGADITLVEPNRNAWHNITEYFSRYELEDRLRSLEKIELENFTPTKKYDFIDAEGFIYTIKPDDLWIKLFNNALKKNGFFIVSYYERYGAVFELILKLIYNSAKNITKSKTKEIAWKLFKKKWLSIPHTRSFDSWVMDVLENPFVRYKYFLDATDLCKKCFENNFTLYSSWPRYQECMDIYWHKKEQDLKKKLKQQIDFIKRSRLSFIFGKKLFVFSKKTDKFQTLLNKFIKLIDKSIDGFDRESINECRDVLKKIENTVNDKSFLLTDSDNVKYLFQITEIIKEILKLLNEGDIKKIIHFCNSNKIFINMWGMPTHFSVFQKNSA